MKKYLAFLLFTVVVGICSCKYLPSATWINDRIDPAVRTEMSPLNKQLFEALYKNDVKDIKQMMAQGLLDSSGNKIDTIVYNVSRALRSKSFSVVDEFYTTNATIGNLISLKTSKGNLNDYTISYKALNSISYAALLKTNGMPVNVSVLAIYGKYDNGWKLNILSTNDYDILGKTGPEYYTAALKEYHKGDTIDAVENILLAGQISKPGGTHFAYDQEADMKAAYSGILTESYAKYHFPITVKQVKTQPKIYDVSPQLIDSGKDKGFYPLVKYTTTVDIADTIALKAENTALQKAVGQLFKGITEDKKCIIYLVVDHIPDGKKPVKQHGFIQRLP